MPKLIELLSDRLGRTVIDKTGFHGTFNFALNFSPEEAAGPRDDFTSPSIFTALQDQLGLQLHSVKGPVTVLVIDHVGRPDEN